MSTLADMKAEIAADIGRSDMTDYIATVISKAIARMQRKRFWFNETRDLTFDTVAGTYQYDTFTSGPVTSLDDVLEIDDVWLEDGGIRKAPLVRIPYEDMEYLTDSNSSQGRPYNWCRYGKKLWLLNKPDQAYTMRVAGHYKVAEPSSDTETDNVWMNDGYDMILSLAKTILYQSRVRNEKFAALDYTAFQAEYRRLRAESTDRMASGFIKPTEF